MVGATVGKGVAGSGDGTAGNDGATVGMGLGSRVGGIVTTGATSEIRSGTGVPFGVIFASSGRRSALRATWDRVTRTCTGRVTTGGTIVGTGTGTGVGFGVAVGTIAGRSRAATVSRLTAIASSGAGASDPTTGENERKMKNKPATT
jgi:hypothetical protein